MSETTYISWPGWETERLIGRGSFGAVYEIQRTLVNEVETAALKVISIPQNASDIDEMSSEGYKDEEITELFQSHLKNIVAEYSLMKKMSGCTNIVNCDDVRYVQHDDGVGWDIFIKMELLTPLTKVLTGEISEDAVIKVGRDMCKALELCKKHEIIHRDIKPQNIFVSQYGDYKLGDFGIAKTVEKTMGGTKIGTYKYMAPEVYNNQPYGTTVDIYSLGLVMYWMLNEKRMPFMPLPPSNIRAGMEENARNRRFAGEKIPAPVHGREGLKRIVLKACAYDSKERYQTAKEMLEDLKNLPLHEEDLVIAEDWVGEETDEITNLNDGSESEETINQSGRNTASNENLDSNSSNRGVTEESANQEMDSFSSKKHCAGGHQVNNKIFKLGLRTVPFLLWGCSICLSFWLLDIVRSYYGFFLYTGVEFWIVLSIVTGWCIPLLSVIAIHFPKRRRLRLGMRRVCKIAVIIQIVFLTYKGVGTILELFIKDAALIRRFLELLPSTMIWNEAFWVDGIRWSDWLPFMACVLSGVILVVKDIGAFAVLSSRSDQ